MHSSRVIETTEVAISCFGEIAGPARSQLSVPDFFLRGLLRDCAFQRRIVTIQEFKQAIVDEVADEGLLRHM